MKFVLGSFQFNIHIFWTQLVTTPPLDEWLWIDLRAIWTVPGQT